MTTTYLLMAFLLIAGLGALLYGYRAFTKKDPHNNIDDIPAVQVPQALSPAEKPAKPTTKICRFCKSEIPIDAQNCRYCGKDVSTAAVLQQIANLLFIISLCILIPLVLAMCGYL
jgi:ribosomal protein L40E